MKEEIIQKIVENTVIKASLLELKECFKQAVSRELHDKDFSEIVKIAKSKGISVPGVFNYMTPELYLRLKDKNNSFMGLKLTRNKENYILAQVGPSVYTIISMGDGNRFKTPHKVESHFCMTDHEIDLIFKPMTSYCDVIWGLKK